MIITNIDYRCLYSEVKPESHDVVIMRVGSILALYYVLAECTWHSNNNLFHEG